MLQFQQHWNLPSLNQVYQIFLGRRHLLDASKEVGLEWQRKLSTHMFMSCHPTTGQNHYIKELNKSGFSLFNDFFSK